MVHAECGQPAGQHTWSKVAWLKLRLTQPLGTFFLPAEYMADPAAAATSVHFETRSDERVKVDFESENNLSPAAPARPDVLNDPLCYKKRPRKSGCWSKQWIVFAFKFNFCLIVRTLLWPYRNGCPSTHSVAKRAFRGKCNPIRG